MKDANASESASKSTADVEAPATKTTQTPTKAQADGFESKSGGSGYTAQIASKADASGTPVGLARIAAKAGVLAPLPDWFPTNWDLDGASKAAASLLVGQGEDPARLKPDLVDHVVFTDADHTLVNTSTPVLLRDAATDKLVHHPVSGEVVTLPSRGYQDAYEELKKEFPKRDWSQTDFDYSGMADATELHRHDVIDETADVLAENAATGRGRQIIITARSSDTIPAAFLEYAQERGLHLDGTFPVNSTQYADTLDFTRFNLDTGQKKAMTMAALMRLYEPKSGALETVRFYEDSDPNMRSAMELLPRLFPKTKFEFWDVIHNAAGGFDQKLVARSDGPFVVNDTGRRLSDAEISTYESDDAPLPEFTGAIEFPTDIEENRS